MSTLHLVATPIGNLEDISARALRILSQVGLIAAEDTRHTARLLQHYGIRTPCLSYHEHNKLTRLERVLAALEAGDVALVSDAGTPALNDPGYELVQAVLAAGHTCQPGTGGLCTGSSAGRLRAAHRHLPVPGLPAAPPGLSACACCRASPPCRTR